jgi:crotonobetainyl-CoA:carnitine CoA-transferase CaiB-like acyl-CoA transferase
VTTDQEAGAAPRGPLSGVRVVDMTAVVFGAYATQILGDLGADVIKVEAPSPTGGGGFGGDIMRWAGRMPEGAAPDLGPIFLTINRNKRSVKLDLRKPAARKVLLKLIATADVLASNVRYDGMKRMGLSYEDVKAVKPDIIFVHAAGYGSDGPYAGEPAYDDLIQAGSGMADIIGRMDGNPKPRYIPTLIADKTSGLFMTWATLAALFHRERTGEGQFVEVPMLESITSFLLAEHFYGHVFDPATGPWGYSRVTSPDRRPYRTKDGHIGLLPYSDKQWDDFFAAAGRPGALSGDPRFATYKARTQHISELYAMIEEVTETRTTEEWLALLKPLNIPVTRMNRLEDLPNDPHLKAVNFFQRMVHPDAGPYFAMRPPVKFSASPADMRRHAPRLGEHNQEVLGELGLTSEELAAIEDAPAKE